MLLLVGLSGGHGSSGFAIMAGSCLIEDGGSPYPPARPLAFRPFVPRGGLAPGSGDAAWWSGGLNGFR